MYQCLECKKEFDEQTAYCEDWRNPNKKLGCPECKTFYKPKNNRHWFMSNLNIFAIVFSALGAIQAVSSSEIKLALYFFIILVLMCVAWWFKDPLPKYTPIEHVRRS